MNDITLYGTNYIGCKKSKKSSDTFNSYNPRTGEKSKITYHEASEIEVDESCKLASKAFYDFKEINEEKRAKFLEKISDEISNLGEILIQNADWETGLGKPRLTNERQRTCNQIIQFANLIRDAQYKEIITDFQDPEIRLQRMLIPIGPVAVFEVSNFPFAFGVCGGDTISALAAGCPVVVKAHPSHPQTSELFAMAVINAIEKSDFPRGIFSILHGKTNNPGMNLVDHQNIKAVGFTGSVNGGRSLFDIAAARSCPIPVYAEMGSVNPVFITQAALKTRSDEMAEQFAQSITLGAGQFCTKPGIFFYPRCKESVGFLHKIVESIKKQKMQSMLNKNIYESIMKHTSELISTGGVELLAGGKKGEIYNSLQNTIVKTDISNYFKKDRLKKEYFGPLAIFVECDSEKQYLEVVEGLNGELTGTIHMEKMDFNKMKILFDGLKEKVGRIIINGVPTGVKVSSAMNHGGPYPATTSVGHTSVGTTAIRRFLRPICYQNIPDTFLKEFSK